MKSTESSIEIVQATPAEVGEAAPLFDAYRQFYGKSADIEAARRFLFARLSKNESVLYLARHEGRAVGFVNLYPVFSSVNLTRQWILNDLYVAPEARKNGIARALLRQARHLADATRPICLPLETGAQNWPAQRLYESLGWRRDQEFYRYYLPL